MGGIDTGQIDAVAATRDRFALIEQHTDFQVRPSSVRYRLQHGGRATSGRTGAFHIGPTEVAAENGLRTQFVGLESFHRVIDEARIVVGSRREHGSQFLLPSQSVSDDRSEVIELWLPS